MTGPKEVIIALSPILQSLVWVALIAWLVYYFRQYIQLLRRELQRRIQAGEQLELGPLKLEKIEQRVTSSRSGARKNQTTITTSECVSAAQPYTIARTPFIVTKMPTRLSSLPLPRI